MPLHSYTESSLGFPVAAAHVAPDAGYGVAVRRAGAGLFDVLAFALNDCPVARPLATGLPAREAADLGARALPDGRVHLWGWGRGEVYDAASARLLERLPDRSGTVAPSLDRVVELRPIVETVTGWSFTRDGDEMTEWRSTVEEDAFRIKDPRSGSELRFERLSGELRQAAWSADGRCLWVASPNGVWRVKEGEAAERVSYSLEAGEARISVSPGGDIAALWSATSIRLQRLDGFEHFQLEARTVEVANDGTIVSISSRGVLVMWRRDRGFVTLIPRPAGAATLLCAGIRADGAGIAWVRSDGVVGSARI